MKVTYGGVELDPVHTTNWSTEPVRDGPQYLYHRVRLQFVFQLNGDAVSVRIRNQAVELVDGLLPSETAKALDHHLNQPRQQFKMTDDDFGKVIYQVPAAGETVDSANGPFSSFSIRQVSGQKSMTGVLDIELHVNICEEFTDDAPFLLANQFTTTHTIDPDTYRTTIQYNGRATFDAAKLPDGTFPDTYRKWLLPPKPPRAFKRGPASVTITEDGLTANWSVTDVERRISITTNKGITRIGCTHSVTLDQESTLDVAREETLRNVEQQFNDGSNVLNSLQDILTGGFGDVIQNVARPAFNTLRSVQRLGGRLLPKFLVTVRVTVQGNTRAKFKDMQEVAYAVASHRIGESPLGANLRATYNVNCAETHDVENGSVTLVCTYRTGLTGQTSQLIQGIGVAFSNQLIGADDDVEKNNATYNQFSGLPGETRPQKDSGARADYVGMALAQVLNDDCEKPAKLTQPASVGGSTNPNRN